MEKSEEICIIPDEVKELMETLPKERNFDGQYLYLYKGFWCPSVIMKGLVFFQTYFQPHDTDIILATIPKSGTTWLKALTFTIVNRTKFPPSQSPLLTTNPHNLVRFLEPDIYSNDKNPNLDEDFIAPRIFATHTPFEALPHSVITSKCRIVYICRNPLDQFVSYWHFIFQIRHENMEIGSIDEAFELFCRGVHGFGPFWDHVLGYWRASVESQHKRVLFLKYEDLKEDVSSQVKKLAEFLGFPFSMEEEKQGLVQEISNLCSFENLKSLQVNKGGRLVSVPWVKNSDFFRKAQVGDWANFLSPSQAQRLEKLTQEKLSGSGLSFKTFYNPSS